MHILVIPSERCVPKDARLEGVFQQHQAQGLKRAGYKVGVISAPELRSVRLLWKGLPSVKPHCNLWCCVNRSACFVESL